MNARDPRRYHCSGAPMCPSCSLRAIDNAVIVWRLVPGLRFANLVFDGEIGCRSCLRGMLVSAAMNLGWLFRRLGFVSLLLWPVVLVRNLAWAIGLTWIGPTTLLRAGLEAAGFTWKEFLAAQPPEDRGTPLGPEQRVDLGHAHAILLRAVVFADRRAGAQERTAVRSYLRFYWSEDPEVFERIDPGSNTGVRPTEPEIEAACERVREWVVPQDQGLLVHFLFGIAEQESGISQDELQCIQDLARRCGIRADIVAQSAAAFGVAIDPQGSRDTRQGSRASGDSHARDAHSRRSAPRAQTNNKDPWTVLGVARTADAAEIRAAWIRLAKTHHPDRCAHLGPAAQAAATRRMQQINRAYEQLKSQASRRS